MNPPAIRIEGVNKSFNGTAALREVNCTIKRGSLVGLLGINGAGKTTLMRLLNGTLYADTGKIWLNGHSLEEEALISRRQIGYLAEVPVLYDAMTVFEYLRLNAQIKGIRNINANRIYKWSEEGMLEDKLSVKLGDLSKGYRQRVGLAAALIGDPSILLLDEPSAGLDPKQASEFRKKISSLKGTQTIVFSSHLLSEVEAICDEVRLLHEGRFLATFARRHGHFYAVTDELAAQKPTAITSKEATIQKTIVAAPTKINTRISQHSTSAQDTTISDTTISAGVEVKTAAIETTTSGTTAPGTTTPGTTVAETNTIGTTVAETNTIGTTVAETNTIETTATENSSQAQVEKWTLEFKLLAQSERALLQCLTLVLNTNNTNALNNTIHNPNNTIHNPNKFNSSDNTIHNPNNTIHNPNKLSDSDNTIHNPNKLNNSDNTNKTNRLTHNDDDSSTGYNWEPLALYWEQSGSKAFRGYEILDLNKDSDFNKNSGLNKDSDLDKDSGLNKDSDLDKDSGFNKESGFNEDSGLNEEKIRDTQKSSLQQANLGIVRTVRMKFAMEVYWRKDFLASYLNLSFLKHHIIALGIKVKEQSLEEKFLNLLRYDKER
ncbi:hypothetical protein COTS27_01471 [Spirochaetota bacterium]|nr:hypothetical protein COTS27_01471 [Spirochaetota bacterium]